MASALVPIGLNLFATLLSEPRIKEIMHHGLDVAAQVFEKIPGVKFTADQSRAAMTVAIGAVMPALNAAVIQKSIPALTEAPNDGTVQAALEALYQSRKASGAVTPAAIAAPTKTQTVEDALLALIAAKMRERAASFDTTAI